MVGADVSTVSKHLSLLKNAGIVEDDKRGTQVFYSLKVPCVLNFFTCVESVLESAGRTGGDHMTGLFFSRPFRQSIRDRSSLTLMRMEPEVQHGTNRNPFIVLFT